MLLYIMSLCVYNYIYTHLVGGLEHFLFFHNIWANIWDVILPIDELIFFKMVIAPPTRHDLASGKLTQLWKIMETHGKSWNITIFNGYSKSLFWLVVWNMFYFSIQLGIIIPTD